MFLKQKKLIIQKKKVFLLNHTFKPKFTIEDNNLGNKNKENSISVKKTVASNPGKNAGILLPNIKRLSCQQ